MNEACAQRVSQERAGESERARVHWATGERGTLPFPPLLGTYALVLHLAEVRTRRGARRVERSAPGGGFASSCHPRGTRRLFNVVPSLGNVEPNIVDEHPRGVLVGRGPITKGLLQHSTLRARNSRRAPALLERRVRHVGLRGAALNAREHRFAELLHAEVEREVLHRVGVVADRTLLPSVPLALAIAVLASDLAANDVRVPVREQG